MNPRTLLNFFKTRSGKFAVFAVLLGSGLVLFGSLRRPTSPGPERISVNPADLDLSTNKNQVVESVSKPMEVFRPPPPKPEPAPAVHTNANAAPAQPPPKAPNPVTPPLTLFAEAPPPEPKMLSSTYAPFGRLISCETVITIDSASIQTPIIGLVTENIYHAGRLVIPAGTEVHGTAQADRSRERIASGTSWRFVWQTGEELALKAIALDREFDNNTNQEGWGITDGSAGLRGRVIKSDDLAEIKLFAATFLSGAANALTEKEQTVLGTLDRPSLNNAPFKGAQQVLAAYAQRIYEAIQRDGFYVRVPSGKQFYLYVLQTIDRADARVGGTDTPLAEEKPQANATAPQPITSNPDLP
jgi:Bacterial conjugation TrbI-like protein